MRTTALLFVFLAMPLFAGEPNVKNAQLEHVRASGDLVSQIAASRGWVGHMLPLAEPRSISCNCDSGCDGDETDELGLLYHVENGEIDAIRVAAPDCRFNAHGEHVAWIDDAGERAAIDALIDIAKHGRKNVRTKALFWLGMQAGAKAAQALRNAVDDDPESEVKTRAVFGISQLPDDQSIPLLVELMKTHRSREVRRKAAFWLSQKSDPRAVSAIEEMLMK
ncbi:MAG TPA: HEAT repeat domain-containing protein [Thermoanaerobaculia bacterium]|nr:HEAT repeat domain-containing protein [Thermoanaerobaculia bacterium]